MKTRSQLRDSRQREKQYDASKAREEAGGPRNLPEAIIIAAEQVGYDGSGEGGLVGYLRRIAQSEPKIFLRLLLELLKDTTIQETEKVEAPVVFETREEVEEDLRQRGLFNMFKLVDDGEP